jgi:hypothetical protein
MSDPGYRILSARYANPEHTAVVVLTAEAGVVAASSRDRPALWQRIHACGIPIEPYGGETVPPIPTEPSAPAPPQPISIEPVSFSWQRPVIQPTLLSPFIVDERELTAAPEPVAVPSDNQRRRDARAAVRDAVAAVNRITSDDHFRYELALLVVNENVEAMSDLKDAAAASALPVKEYAKRVIAIHNARRRRAAQIYAIEAQALKDTETATGEAIEEIAVKAVARIRGND